MLSPLHASKSDHGESSQALSESPCGNVRLPPMSAVRPTASTSLELLRLVEATYKKLGRNILQPLPPLPNHIGTTTASELASRALDPDATLLSSGVARDDGRVGTRCTGNESSGVGEFTYGKD